MIAVEHLTKRYGKHLAIDDLTFTVEKGKVYGFLGPNGAGKSTTMNIIAGCLASTSGKASVNGFDILENPVEAKKQIGYLPEIPPVYTDRTVREYLRYVSELKKIEKKDIPSEIDRVIDLTDIRVYENRLIRHLSKGYRQRVGIAEALLGNPEVIILDEPTVGLDPQQIIEVRALISSLREAHTVILSSHILSEIQAVCDMILMINHGKIVACDTPENLEKKFESFATVEASFMGDGEAIASGLREAFSEAELKTVEIAGGENENAAVSVVLSKAEDTISNMARRLWQFSCEKDYPLTGLVQKHLSLEEIFIELTKEQEKSTSRENEPNEAEAPVKEAEEEVTKDESNLQE